MRPTASDRKIRVLLVDDHPVVLGGVRSALSGQRNIEVVGEASSGKEGLRKAKELAPDIVLMDIGLPSMTGIEATKRLREVLPQVKVLAFTMHDNKEYILEVIRQGAKGYILKNTSTDELVRGIEAVHRGDTFFSTRVSKVLLDQYVAHVAKGKIREDLSSREKEILALIASGLSSKEIAARLNVSPRTIETHREKIMNKLNIHTAVGLARYAISKGIAKADES